MIFSRQSIFLIFFIYAFAQPAFTQTIFYFNRAPLKADVYSQLPLGSIKAKGWLLTQLELQRDGATGHAEELYAGKNDLGKDADWLGGDGNSWEKAPYYLKGLIALAYTLNDTALKIRAQKWIDYTLDHQQANGLFGPPKMKDWWPRMPFMYALQGYYEATGDKRVVPFLSKYFKYELDSLDKDPLRDWGRARAADNIEIVLWLYNHTGEKHLLDLATKLKSQAYPWADIHNRNEFFYTGRDFHTRHMVSVAQALKFPSVYSQVDSSEYYTDAMKNGIAFLLRDHGQPNGLAAGTEMAAGKSSIQGVETCTVVEWMQSLETAYRIIRDASIGDQLEKIAFNALPAQFNSGFKNHSYYTLPNQVQSLPGPHGFNQDYANGIVPGAYSGYPCCRYNMHMGWPYLVKNSWSATPDGGLAVTIYAPMELRTVLRNGVKIQIDEDTNYPFEEQIRLNLSLSKSISFPLYLRVPGWCTNPVILVNGKVISDVKPGRIIQVKRKWSDKDQIVLNFPMEAALQPQVNNGVSLERGPLVYALQIKENIKVGREYSVGGFYETEISPASPWNYGLMLTGTPVKNDITVVKNSMPVNPFIQETTPVKLKIRGKRIPAWVMDYNNTAALDVPFSPVISEEPAEEITLVPFGSETLRLSIFPVIGTPAFESKMYRQTFENNTMPGWVAYGGGWFCKDDKMHVVANEDGGSGNGSKVIATGTRFSNFEYTADISVNGPGDAGLMFRVTDPAIGPDLYKGYYLGLNAETGTIQLGKVSNRQWMVIASAKFPMELNKTYQVKLKAVGDRFEVFVNGEADPALSATDRHYSEGSIGVRAYKALVTVDNIVVKAL